VRDCKNLVCDRLPVTGDSFGELTRFGFDVYAIFNVCLCLFLMFRVLLMFYQTLLLIFVAGSAK